MPRSALRTLRMGFPLKWMTRTHPIALSILYQRRRCGNNGAGIGIDSRRFAVSLSPVGRK
jgi:hypothetical protein